MTSTESAPIFIIGNPKSGTSLLVSLLDNHPDLMVLPEETDFYSRVWPRIQLLNIEWNKARDEKRDTLHNFIVNQTHVKNYFRGKVDEDISGNFDYSGIDSQQLSSKLKILLGAKTRYSRKKVLLSIVEGIRGAAQNERSYKYWVEKTPKHTWSIDIITRDFPDAKFIFICRDPRDNYASYKKKYNDNYSPFQFSKAWNSAFDQLDGIDGDRVLLVRYEDLVSDLIGQIEKVRNFLDIRMADSLQIPSKFGRAWKGNSMFDSKSDLIRNDSVKRYKSLLSEHEILVVESFCEMNMKKYSYEPENSIENLHEFRFNNLNKYNKSKGVLSRGKYSFCRKYIKTLISGVYREN